MALYDVWAEITLPKPMPAIRAVVLRRFFAPGVNHEVRPAPRRFALLVAQ